MFLLRNVPTSSVSIPQEMTVAITIWSLILASLELLIPQTSLLPNFAALVAEVVALVQVIASPITRPLIWVMTTAPGIKPIHLDVEFLMTMISLLPAHAALVEVETGPASRTLTSLILLVTTAPGTIATQLDVANLILPIW